MNENTLNEALDIETSVRKDLTVYISLGAVVEFGIDDAGAYALENCDCYFSERLSVYDLRAIIKRLEDMVDVLENKEN